MIHPSRTAAPAAVGTLPTTGATSHDSARRRISTSRAPLYAALALFAGLLPAGNAVATNYGDPIASFDVTLEDRRDRDSYGNETKVLQYRHWSGKLYELSFEWGRFRHAPDGEWGEAHTSDWVDYTLRGTKWRTRFEDGCFVHVPVNERTEEEGHVHRSKFFPHDNWDGKRTSALLLYHEAQVCTGDYRTTFDHYYLDGRAGYFPIVDDRRNGPVIQYEDWQGINQAVHLENGNFIRTTDQHGNVGTSHHVRDLQYVYYGPDLLPGSRADAEQWTAVLTGDGGFVHRKRGETRTHVSNILHYLTAQPNWLSTASQVVFSAREAYQPR